MVERTTSGLHRDYVTSWIILGHDMSDMAPEQLVARAPQMQRERLYKTSWTYPQMAAIVKISVKTNEQSKHIIHNCNILQLCAWSSNTLGLLASALWLNQNLNIQNQFTSIYDNSRLVLEGGKTLWPLLHCQGKSLRLLRKSPCYTVLDQQCWLCAWWEISRNCSPRQSMIALAE